MKRILGGVAVVVLVVATAWFLKFRHGGDSAPSKAAEKAAGKVPSLAVQHTATKAEPRTSSIDLDEEGPLRLEGQVVGHDGHGVGGAEVWLGSVPPRTTKTEQDGSFSFDKLVGRSYRLTARHANDVGGPVVYKLSDHSDPAILELAGGAKVTVTVTDDAKHPIANAKVQVEGDTTTSVVTDAAGNAAIAPVHPGWVSVWANADGYAANTQYASIGSAGATGHVDMILHAGVTVSGHVIDGNGKPIAKAQVATSGLWQFDSSTLPVTSDDKGGFTLVLPAGTHTLSASDSVHAPSRSTPLVVTTKPVDGVEIVMKVGGRIAGRVVDTNHQPVGFATVRLAGKGNDIFSVPRRQTTTKADGTFELRGLARTKLDLRAESDTNASKIMSVDLTTQPEQTTTELVLDVGGTISGVVVDDKNQPVSEVQVSAMPDVFGGGNAESFMLAGLSTATTDGAGAFTIHGLPDGAYKVRAQRSAANQWERAMEGTSAKTGDKNVKLVLATPGSIKGLIVKSDGSSPAIAMVRAGMKASTPANAGAFLLDDIDPGSYDVTFHGPDFGDVIKHDIKVEAGKQVDMGTITVARGRVLSGRVTDSANNPVAGARVKVGRMLYQFQGAEDQMSTFEDATNTRTAYTDQSGNFVVVGISTQHGNAMAEADAGRSDAIEVAEGDQDPPAIALKLHGFGMITGKVTVKGQPATSVAITDTPKTGGAQVQIVQCDDTGGFTIGKATEGMHVVSAMQQGGMGTSFKSVSTTVTVTAGKSVSVALDIPVGTITLSVAIKPAARATLNAAQIFLMHGTVTMTNAKQLQDAFLAGSVTGMKFWFGSTPAEFDELVAGDYSACSVPITGNMSDPQFMQRLQANMESLKVYCKLVKVTPTPAAQTLVQELPAMDPLPAPKT
ncbi:hypothetical protein BH11MYX1_BH11MYX1_33400 [soil metagenome]